MKTIAQLILWFAFISPGFAADPARESQTDDIREAVFRWQFAHNASGLQTNASVYFIAIGEKGVDDPADAFMKRFAGHQPPVRQVSACSASAAKGVLDKRTGKKGLIFRVTGIKWISDAEVEVRGGYYEAGLSSSGNTFTVKKKNGQWKVAKDRMDWIS